MSLEGTHIYPKHSTLPVTRVNICTHRSSIFQQIKKKVQLAIEILLRLFADDVILMSSTPAGLQNQLIISRMKQTACILVLTLIRHVLCFFVWADIWLREKDGCMMMKRSRLQMDINICGLHFLQSVVLTLCFHRYVKRVQWKFRPYAF